MCAKYILCSITEALSIFFLLTHRCLTPYKEKYMNDNVSSPSSIDFQVDKENLFREETITDLKIATIRKLIPIKADGSDDLDRGMIFIGTTQLGTPQGPIPMQAVLEAATFEQAMIAFPLAMEAETQKVIENLKKMHEQQKKTQDSRIIIPGVQ